MHEKNAYLCPATAAQHFEFPVLALPKYNTDMRLPTDFQYLKYWIWPRGAFVH